MNLGLQTKGRIFNIQKYSIYDGYGIRTLVFLKGCNIYCPWCANPESLCRGFQIMYAKDRCTNCGRCSKVCPVNIHSMVVNEFGEKAHYLNREINCTGCRECEDVCVSGALDIVGDEVTVEEVMEIIMQDYDFYVTSGGGVTLGGGEMSLQIDFAVELLTQCKRMMINTAIETNGSTKLANFERLAACTDLFLFDLKNMDTDEHKRIHGVGNERILRNLERLIELNANVIVRVPIIKGYNGSVKAITGIIHYVLKLSEENGKNCIKRIEVLPYHQYGKSKYDKLDMIYPVSGDHSYSDEELDELSVLFKQYDFDIRIVRN